MQAIAAAMLEGKPVEVDFGPGSGPGLGGGGGGIGSWSGMIYIHKMKNALSSNLAFSALFAFRSPERTASLTEDCRIKQNALRASARFGFKPSMICKRKETEFWESANHTVK